MLRSLILLLIPAFVLGEQFLQDLRCRIIDGEVKIIAKNIAKFKVQYGTRRTESEGMDLHYDMTLGATFERSPNPFTEVVTDVRLVHESERCPEGYYTECRWDSSTFNDVERHWNTRVCVRKENCNIALEHERKIVTDLTTRSSTTEIQDRGIVGEDGVSYEFVGFWIVDQKGADSHGPKGRWVSKVGNWNTSLFVKKSAAPSQCGLKGLRGKAKQAQEATSRRMAAPRKLLGDTQEVCKQKADIVFVVDISYSIGTESYQVIKDVLEATINDLNVDEDEVRVGLVYFGNADEVEVEFDLNDYVELKGKMITQIKNKDFPSFATDIGAAFAMARTEVFEKEDQARKSVKNILLLVTDAAISQRGRFGLNKLYTKMYDERTKTIEKDILIMAVGAGSDVKEEQIKSLATRTDLAFFAESDDEGNFQTDQLISAVKQAVGKGRCTIITQPPTTEPTARPTMPPTPVPTPARTPAPTPAPVVPTIKPTSQSLRGDCVDDIVFILDDSESINDKEFAKVIDGVISVVRKLSIADDKTRVATILFHNTVRSEIDLDDFVKDADGLVKALKGIYHDTGSTHIDLAIEYATDKILLAEDAGGRQKSGDKANDIIVLVTDGYFKATRYGGGRHEKFDTDEESVKGTLRPDRIDVEEATYAKSKGITIISVGVGSNMHHYDNGDIDPIALKMYASEGTHGRKLVYTSEKFDDVGDMIATGLSHTGCDDTPTPTTAPTCPDTTRYCTVCSKDSFASYQVFRSSSDILVATNAYKDRVMDTSEEWQCAICSMYTDANGKLAVNPFSSSSYNHFGTFCLKDTKCSKDYGSSTPAPIPWTKPDCQEDFGMVNPSTCSEWCETCETWTCPPTLAPTLSPTVSPTRSPTLSPTRSPTLSPTKSPTLSPTLTPTKSPTKSPSLSPTESPTKSPTRSPTLSPTKSPTLSPTLSPTRSPTKSPTRSPTLSPTKSPTLSPTLSPTKSPTKSPTLSPTLSPTKSPSRSPTLSPTKSPTKSPTLSPTKSPTLSPTKSPTLSPTKSPTLSPTKSPTLAPTLSPTKSPTLAPTLSPTKSPTLSPTKSPTLAPTLSPTRSPTRSPTLSPTKSPTLSPTLSPTKSPTLTPTLSPTSCKRSEAYQEAVTYKNNRQCHYVINLSPDYEEINTDAYNSKKATCSRRRRLRGSRGGRSGGRGGGKSCEDQAKEAGQNAVSQAKTNYEKKIRADDQNKENGLAYCMGLVQGQYNNPRFGEHTANYNAEAFSVDKKAEGGSHAIYKSFVVPIDLDDVIPGDSQTKYSRFGDWIGRVPPAETDDQYNACAYEYAMSSDIDIYADADNVGSCWTEMEPCSDDDADGYCACEDADSDTCGFFLLLEGEVTSTEDKEPNQFVFVTYKRWEEAPFAPISPCSSGMFHWETGEFCGCCAGRGKEGHYIFPTPMDLADSDQSRDDLVYLTRKTYSSSQDCGESSTVTDLAKKNREFTAVERQYTHYRYETYKAVCGSLTNTYDDCIRNGCTPRTNSATGKKYTKKDWTNEKAACEPRCKDREECNKNDKDAKLMCSHFEHDEMCLGAACVWHIQTERCTGRVSFRSKDCTRNCSNTGGISGDWGAQGQGEDSSTTRRLDIPTMEVIREVSIFGPEMRRIEVSSRELSLRDMEVSIFDNMCTELTPKHALRHCNIDSKDRIIVLSMD